MRLSTRLALTVSGLLAVVSIAAALVLYDSVRRSIERETERRLDDRLAWLASSINLEDNRAEFEQRVVPANGAEFWSVSTNDGRVLWASKPPRPNPQKSSVAKEMRVILGGKESPVAPSAELIEAKAEDGREFPAYEVPAKKHRLELVLAAQTRNDQSARELNRLAITLWTVVPVGAALVILIMAWFIRWQLRPLSLIAAQASEVGPNEKTREIVSASSSREIVELQQAINSLIKRLSDGLEQEKQFSAFVAHELRTPLAQMRTNAEVMLRRERAAEEYRECVSESLEDINRLQGLVNGLLALTRARWDGGKDVAFARLRDVVAAAGRQTGMPAVCVWIPEDVEVCGHPEMLAAAVANVFENARRYAPGILPEILFEPDSKTARMVIQDSGPGVPEKERERIFDPMIRLDNARSISSEKGGYGLGLAVARSVMRATGGELSCEERSDGLAGAQFMFVFKLRAS